MKILSYHIDDLIADEDAVAEKLNWLCRQHTRRWKVESVCQRFDEVFFLLTEQEEVRYTKYLIKSVKSATSDELKNEFMSHWETYHNCKGLIKITDREFLAVYEKVSQD